MEAKFINSKDPDKPPLVSLVGANLMVADLEAANLELADMERATLPNNTKYSKSTDLTKFTGVVKSPKKYAFIT